LIALSARGWTNGTRVGHAQFEIGIGFSAPARRGTSAAGLLVEPTDDDGRLLITISAFDSCLAMIALVFITVSSSPEEFDAISRCGGSPGA